MNQPFAALGALLFLLASLSARAEEMDFGELAFGLKCGGDTMVGIIYPADGTVKMRVAAGEKRLLKEPATAEESALWLSALNDKVLAKQGGKALREAQGPVLLTDQSAVRLHGLMTHPVSKGEYTGFEFLKLATADLALIMEGGTGGQMMFKKFELKEDVPARPLGELMSILCASLGGNYWSLSQAVSIGKDGKPVVRPEMPVMLLPMVGQVSRQWRVDEKR